MFKKNTKSIGPYPIIFLKRIWNKNEKSKQELRQRYSTPVFLAER